MPSSHQDTKTIAYNTATLRTGNALGASSDYFECLAGRQTEGAGSWDTDREATRKEGESAW